MSPGTPMSTRQLSTEKIDPNSFATSKLVDMVLLLAIKDIATNVSFEPREKDYRLSYRCAGQDYEMVPPPRNRAARISQTFKILAHLDLRNRQTPQEGMLRCLVDDEGADVRISIQPTRYGESVFLTIENNTTQWERARELLAEATSPPSEDSEDEKVGLEDDWTDPPTISRRSAESEGVSFCHRLVSQGGATPGEWTLEWDDVNFCLSDPHGILVLEAAPHHAGWCVDCFTLYASDQFWFYADAVELADSSLAKEIALDTQQRKPQIQEKPGRDQGLAKSVRTIRPV